LNRSIKGIRRKLIRIGFDIPLMGCIAFGLIDRGTNLIQVRPISSCPLSCVFCSTDAGPASRNRASEFIIEDLDWLIDWFRSIVKLKGERKIEAHIDTVGDPLTYGKLVDLVQMLKDVKGVETISMQTHGAFLDEKTAVNLAEAGLSRINLSIDSTDPHLAKKLSQTDWYDVKKIMEVAEFIAKNTKMDILIAPIWIPGMNDHEIPRIIEFALRIGAGKKVPPLGIQKYLIHKYGRKVKGIRPISWRKFYSKLREWSNRYQVKLKLDPSDFKMHKRKRVPLVYKIGEVLRVKVFEDGWLRGEKLAVARDKRRVITLVNSEGIEIGSWVKARIIGNKDNIYIARPS